MNECLIMCMTAFESYGSSSENVLQLSCEIHHLKVVLCKRLGGLVECCPVENKKR